MRTLIFTLFLVALANALRLSLAKLKLVSDI
jgi:hypothetical protein